MVNALQNAVNAMWASLQTSAGVLVTYTQGSTTISNLPAVPGVTTTESEFADGTVRTERIADFVVNRSDMSELVPAKGDRIVWDERTYEVMHPAGGRVYEESGPFKQLYRVHTKEVYGG